MRDKMNDPARLALIEESIGNIEEFLSAMDSYELFVQNKVLCHAVIYNLQCIGESVYKLSKEYIAEHPQIDWAAIEGLRHVLVHDYYQVDMETVWGIIKQDIPVLKSFLDSEA